jgi:hypothetical protein
VTVLVNSVKKMVLTVPNVLETESTLHLVSVHPDIMKTQITVNVNNVVTDVLNVSITEKLTKMNQECTVPQLVPPTESTFHSVFVQKDIMISKLLIVKLVDQNVLLVLLGMFVKNVKPQNTILKTLCVIKIVECTSGLMMLKENVNLVTNTVLVVLDLKTTDVVDVSQVDIYSKENVYLNVQITTMKPSMVNTDLVNHVPAHVKNVSDQMLTNVKPVVLVPSYLTKLVTQLVQMDIIQIMNTESVLLVPLNVLPVTLMDPTEPVVDVNLQTISLTNIVVLTVQKNTSKTKLLECVLNVMTNVPLVLVMIVVILVTTDSTKWNAVVLLHVLLDISLMKSPENVSHVKIPVGLVLKPTFVMLVEMVGSYGKDNVMKDPVYQKTMPLYHTDYMDLVLITNVKNVTIPVLLVLEDNKTNVPLVVTLDS